jgi:hypothetical protein
MSEQFDLFVESTVERLILDREAAELRVEVSCVFGDEKRRSIVARGIDDFLIDDLQAMQMWKAKSASHIRTATTAAAG